MSYYEQIKKMQTNKQTNMDERIINNLLLVVKIAQEYNTGIVPLDDLIQEGNLALIKASNKYNESKGIKFSTFAASYIRGYIKSYIQNNRLIRQPSSYLTMLRKVNKVKNKFIQKHGVAPTNLQIACLLKTSVKKINKILANEIISISQYEHDLPEEKEDYSVYFNTSFDTLFECLSDKEKMALKCRYIDGLTLKECASILNISLQGVLYVVNKAIDKIRQNNTIQVH